MAGFDVLRWRRRKDQGRSYAPRISSAAGQSYRPPPEIEPPIPAPRKEGRPRGAITASAQVLPVGDRRDAMRARYTRQGWQCVDPETEALTRDGWRRYDELAVGDEILTLDLDSGLSTWKPILQLNVYDVTDAEMLSMEGRLHSSLSTLNHRWPVLRRLAGSREYACTIAGCDRQGFARGWCYAHYRRWLRDGDVGTEPVAGTGGAWRPVFEPKIVYSADLTKQDRLRTAAPCADLPVDAKWSDAFVELVAWFWTEGHAKRQVRGFYGVISQSHSVNPTYVARIRAALIAVYGSSRESLRDLPEPGWREWTGDDGMTTFGLNIAAMQVLAQAVDMPDKIVTPAFVLSLTRAQLELFVQTSIDADGHRANGTGIISQSVRARLAAIELAAILTGRTPHTYWSASSDTGGRWITHLRDKTSVNPIDAARVAGAGSAKATRQTYSGLVWCPTVTTGTWFARRRGTVYITSNSEAFAYLDGVGELRYMVQTSANAVSRVRMFPAMQVDPKEPPVPLDELGTSEIPSTVAAAAAEDMDVLNEPGHGLSAMQHTQSINKQTVAEYYIVGLPFDPDTGGESWTIRSIDEVVIDTDGRYYLRDRPPGFSGYDEPPLPLGPDVYIARCWDQHPRFRALAWCQMRPLLESLEELMLASRSIRSGLRSRLAGAGILLVPDELELLGIDPTNADPQSNPFFEELTKAMLTPIQSEGDASEVVPVVVRGPAEILKELRHLTLDRPFDQHTMAIRGELIRRIAIGVDWPPELLLGVGDVSHWAQWFIDESTFRYHYEPQVIQSARQFTQGYAQPLLLARQWDGAAAEKAQQVVWWYDATELLTHPDRTKDAIQLYTMDVLNDEALLRAAGFDPETDRPSEADFLVRLMSKFRTLPPNIVEAIIHRFDPSLDIPPDKSEPGMGPQGNEPPIEPPPAGGGGGGAPPSPTPTGRSGPPTPEQEAVVAAAIARLLGRDRIEITAAASTAPQHSDGAMLALYPTPEQAAELAVDGGEDPDVLHVTLAYLGKASDLAPEQLAAARTVAQSIAGLHAPLAGTYGGVARFTASESSDGMDPIVALPDVQGLVALRNMLCEHLSAAGIPLPSEHGFTAHTTLAYVEADADSPVDRLDPVDATFGAISLVVGGNRTDYPLTGVAEPLVAAADPALNLHAAASRRLAAIDRQLRERLRTAADAALRRQLEKAAARIASRLNGKPDLRAAIKDIPTTHYAAVLGRDALASAGIDPKALLGDDYASLKDQSRAWFAIAQKQALDTAGTIAPITASRRSEIETMQAAHRDAAWAWLAAGLGGVAADRLFDPSPEPAPQGETSSGFLVDASMIRAAVAIAGGFGSNEGSQGLDANGQPVDGGERLGGIGTGVTITATLEEMGAEVVEWQWIYGASERSFEPHVALDGLTYGAHDDEQLTNSNGWPETDFFYPGDHEGCDCTEEPTWGMSLASGDTEAVSAGEEPDQGVAASALVRPFEEAATRLLVKQGFSFNPDQPREDDGRFAPTGSSEEKSGGRDATLAAATERLGMVKEKIGAAIANGQTSEQLFKDPSGNWTSDRMAQQDAVVNALYDRAQNVPNEQQAVVLGGIPGAGKSSSLAETGIDSSQYLTLNPDETRDEMLRQGMGIPVEGLDPREGASLIHEESSQLTSRLADRAYGDGKNVVWDITMDPKPGDNPASSVERRIGALDSNGYRTEAVFVRADPAVAADRALGRYAAGIGTDLGGRPTSGMSGSGSTSSSATATNEDVFNQVKDQVSGWSLYDNNGSSPQLVGSGGDMAGGKAHAASSAPIFDGEGATDG